MAKGKHYAIRVGYDKQNGQVVHGLIVDTWDKASQYVTGINQKTHGVAPEYKSFTSHEDAVAYVSDTGTFDLLETECLHLFVDGSYSQELNNYSFGLCAVYDGNIIYMHKGLGTNKNYAVHRQVGGELSATLHGLQFAKSKGFRKIVIHHDYNGIRYHATGEWARNNDLGREYYEWYQRFIREYECKIEFNKVSAHTGVEFNEIADGLAKIACGLEPNNIYYTVANKYKLKI